MTAMQNAADKFERRDPWPQVPYSQDESDQLPSLAEAVGWVVLGASFAAVCIGFLGVA